MVNVCITVDVHVCAYVYIYIYLYVEMNGHMSIVYASRTPPRPLEACRSEAWGSVRGSLEVLEVPGGIPGHECEALRGHWDSLEGSLEKGSVFFLF